MPCIAYVEGQHFFIGDESPVIPFYIPEAVVAQKKRRRNRKVKSESPVDSAVVIDYDTLLVGQQTNAKARRFDKVNSKHVYDKSEWHSFGRYTRRCNESNHRAKACERKKLRHEVVIYH